MSTLLISRNGQLTTYGILLIVSGSLVLIVFSIVLAFSLAPTEEQSSKTLRAMIPVVIFLLVGLVVFVVLTFAFDADIRANNTVGSLKEASGLRGTLTNKTTTVVNLVKPSTRRLEDVRNVTRAPNATTEAVTPKGPLRFPRPGSSQNPDLGMYISAHSLSESGGLFRAMFRKFRANVLTV
ncbi:hypothetical protein HPB50_019237 [Hyalomma asiaticum]|uniref:Uncharacterized protein n=1 Tax=Hyalomma asiaticum TaxID=266040 RepID=A0ACB7S4D6_HYAAI|nr:hypothetical protein HPB50_019237 [Hyalomma asiaticum]